VGTFFYCRFFELPDHQSKAGDFVLFLATGTLMKTRLLLAIAISTLISATAHAEWVSGYTRKDGTYVAPHTRTDPNSTTFDNYSTKGNYSPSTGKEGSRDPYALPTSPNPYYGGSNKRTRSGW
jgi:hypothetical protein